MSAIINSGGGGGGSFTTLTGGTNTGNSFVLGNGSSISTTGTGTIGAAGSNTQVQFNDSGVLNGDAQFTFTKSTGAVTVGTTSSGATFQFTITTSGGGGIAVQNTSATDAIAVKNVSLTNVFLVGSAGDVGAGNISFVTAAPSLLGAVSHGYDSTTKTGTFQANANGVTSFSGAWNNTNVTPVTVNANVATDQSLMTVSVPAGTLNRVGRSLRVWCAGVFSTPAAQTEVLTFKVKLGALTLISIPIPSQSFTATNNQFNISSVLSVQTGGATGVFEAHGNLVIDLGVGNLVADSTFADQNTAVSSTIDLTAAQTLQITVSASVASTSNSFTQRQMVSETVG
jgi:hypothetical protein